MIELYGPSAAWLRWGRYWVEVYGIGATNNMFQGDAAVEGDGIIARGQRAAPLECAGVRGAAIELDAGRAGHEEITGDLGVAV